MAGTVIPFRRSASLKQWDGNAKLSALPLTLRISKSEVFRRASNPWGRPVRPLRGLREVQFHSNATFAGRQVSVAPRVARRSYLDFEGSRWGTEKNGGYRPKYLKGKPKK